MSICKEKEPVAKSSNFASKASFAIGSRAVFIFFLLMLASCGRSSSGYGAKVALDPSWSTLNVPGRANNVTAFSLELIEEVGKEEKLAIGIYERSWDNLLLGLNKGDYEAICTSMEPQLFHEKTYVFSEIYLATGSVLVVPIHSSLTSLEELAGKDLAVLNVSTQFLEKYPQIIQHPYNSVQQAFSALIAGEVQAALIDRLTAQAFVNDLYAGELKIASHPLTNDGIRLVGLKKRGDHLIKIFNDGLARLKESGVYQKLSQKWGLSEGAKT